MTWDVCVVGAGPAGLSAAALLAEHGATVVVVDEQHRAGGQYYRQPSAAVRAVVGDHRPAGARLIARAESAGASFSLGASVWGVADGGRTLLLSADSGATVDRLQARCVVVATGATERSLPFAGWQLPQVSTVGYAQHLAAEGVRLGDRVLVAGSGPFLLPVACSLVMRGVEVVGVLEEGRPYRLSRTALPALRHPARLREFAGYRARLAAARVPVRCGHRLLSASSSGAQLRVVEISDRRGAVPREHLVDALCAGYGFRPQIDLLRLLGCATRTDAGSGDEIVIVDDTGATSVHGVWAAGEVTGIAGAEAALAEGAVVAADILEALSITAARTVTTSADVRRRRAFAEVSAALYPSPRSLAARAAAELPDDAMVCRCEAVAAGDVRAAARADSDIHAVKSSTRAGMGPCQGRECAPAVAALCGSDGSSFTARMPLRPVSLAAIAAWEQCQ